MEEDSAPKQDDNKGTEKEDSVHHTYRPSMEDDDFGVSDSDPSTWPF